MITAPLNVLRSRGLLGLLPSFFGLYSLQAGDHLNLTGACPAASIMYRYFEPFKQYPLFPLMVATSMKPEQFPHFLVVIFPTVHL